MYRGTVASGRSFFTWTRGADTPASYRRTMSDDEVVDVFGTRVGVERVLARQADLAVAVDLDALDDDLVALVEHVLDGADALARDLADVEQAVGAGHDLDERADLDDLLHDAVVELADLGLDG